MAVLLYLLMFALSTAQCYKHGSFASLTTAWRYVRLGSVWLALTIPTQWHAWQTCSVVHRELKSWSRSQQRQDGVMLIEC